MTIGRKHGLGLDHLFGHQPYRIRRFFLDRRVWTFLEILLLILFFFYICVNAVH